MTLARHIAAALTVAALAVPGLAGYPGAVGAAAAPASGPGRVGEHAPVHVPDLFSTEAGACRAPAPTTTPRITAFFAFPRATMAENVGLYGRMCADAITFGSRVVPVTTGDLPQPVRRLIPAGTRLFRYLGGIRLRPAALAPGDRQVRIGTTTWTFVRAGDAVVVASDADGDATGTLVAAGNREGRGTYLGLPCPQRDPATPYLPDGSYEGVLLAFTERFVRDALLDGAEGFYQSVEMPVGGAAGTWGPVLDLYAAQNRVVAAARPGARVIVSPFLESRLTKVAVTPEQAATGAQALVATAEGTDLVIAPQDGLGTGTTALRADRAVGRVAPTEAYFAAMARVLGRRLWTNVELMRPTTGAGRAPTTRARALQQLRAEAPYVAGAIAFLWEDQQHGIGAVRVVGGLDGLVAGA